MLMLWLVPLHVHILRNRWAGFALQGFSSGQILRKGGFFLKFWSLRTEGRNASLESGFDGMKGAEQQAAGSVVWRPEGIDWGF